ncbi:hypothetical protein [Neisseria animalis]|uniref:Scaffolding protein n=1 Tax=Neisseria animalis TaxID=492 RepID=A0A5P3MVK2_NEIAN|nr:hypothetical protein [Neisseria animalis]QEY24791.1 hypothetical protein D0T90_10195 [Neisseria animalis]ROW31538.1 hypothetical protein CGZ60_09800 [Neisseria animalis]
MSFTIADNLPAHVKERLLALKNGSGDEADREDDFEETAEETGNLPDDTAGMAEPESEYEDATVHEEDVEPDDKTANDINAWKGRLKKEQEEKERYRIAAENGSFAAAKLLEMQEREKQREAELEELRREREAWQKSKMQTPEDDGDVFSETEMEALSLEMGGESARILAEKLKGLRRNVPASDDVAQLRAEIAQAKEAERRRVWFEAMGRDIPEIQGLLTGNQAFVDFLQSETDFSGNSAFDMVRAAGETMDAGKIPMIRALIDKFNQRGEVKEKRVATAKPAGGGTPMRESGGKKRAGKKEWAERERLMRSASPDDFRAFLNKYDWS